jgi:glutamate synthase (NADPH/NADH) large chain
VLGRTGRNFAAGMSGGVAYVLDEDGTFETRCNMAMVGLEAVVDSGDPEALQRILVKEHLGRHDAERLRHLIENHAKFAGSRRATEILSAWEKWVGKFRKVMPHEFRRALGEMQKLAAEQPRLAAGA